MKTHVLFAAAVAAATLAAASPALAVPTQVSFAGRLVDADGPVEGTVQLEFRLYDGSTLVWEESHGAVTATGGLVFAALGSVDPEGNPLDRDVFTGDALALEIVVDGQALAPRLPIRAVPYAIRAGIADEAARLGTLRPGDVARVNHDHAGRYLPVGGTLACAGTQKMTGIAAATGNVVCAADVTGSYLPGAGLSLVGSTFSIASLGVTAAHLAASAVTADKLATGAVTTVKLADGAVTAAKLATNAVTTDKLATSAVTGAKIAIGAISSSHVGTGQIIAGHLAADAVTTIKLQNGAVTTDKLANGAVTSAKLGANAVTASALSGAEVSLYSVSSAGCTQAVGTLTLASQCTTGPCGGTMFEQCNGTCGAATQQSCPNTLAGKLLSPSF